MQKRMTVQPLSKKQIHHLASYLFPSSDEVKTEKIRLFQNLVLRAYSAQDKQITVHDITHLLQRVKQGHHFGPCADALACLSARKYHYVIVLLRQWMVEVDNKPIKKIVNDHQSLLAALIREERLRHLAQAPEHIEKQIKLIVRELTEVAVNYTKQINSGKIFPHELQKVMIPLWEKYFSMVTNRAYLPEVFIHHAHDVASLAEQQIVSNIRAGSGIVNEYRLSRLVDLKVNLQSITGWYLFSVVWPAILLDYQQTQNKAVNTAYQTLVHCLREGMQVLTDPTPPKTEKDSKLNNKRDEKWREEVRQWATKPKTRGNLFKKYFSKPSHGGPRASIEMENAEKSQIAQGRLRAFLLSVIQDELSELPDEQPLCAPVDCFAEIMKQSETTNKLLEQIIELAKPRESCHTERILQLILEENIKDLIQLIQGQKIDWAATTQLEEVEHSPLSLALACYLKAGREQWKKNQSSAMPLNERKNFLKYWGIVKIILCDMLQSNPELLHELALPLVSELYLSEVSCSAENPATNFKTKLAQFEQREVEEPQIQEKKAQRKNPSVQDSLDLFQLVLYYLIQGYQADILDLKKLENGPAIESNQYHMALHQKMLCAGFLKAACKTNTVPLDQDASEVALKKRVNNLQQACFHDMSFVIFFLNEACHDRETSDCLANKPFTLINNDNVISFLPNKWSSHDSIEYSYAKKLKIACNPEADFSIRIKAVIGVFNVLFPFNTCSEEKEEGVETSPEHCYQIERSWIRVVHPLEKQKKEEKPVKEEIRDGQNKNKHNAEKNKKVPPLIAFFERLSRAKQKGTEDIPLIELKKK